MDHSARTRLSPLGLPFAWSPDDGAGTLGVLVTRAEQDPATVVLLHALPLDGSMWAAELRELALKVIAPTLYPLGESIEAWAEAVLELAGPGPLVLIGNSIGGSCAVEVARLAPERVRQLVLIGAKASHRPEPDYRDAAVRLLSQHGMHAAWSAYWQPLFAPDADPGVVETARRLAFAQDVDAIIRGVRVFHGRPDRTSFIESVDFPILVISGEHDRKPSNARALAASVRNGSFALVERSGHDVPLEQPTMLQAILAGLAGIG